MTPGQLIAFSSLSAMVTNPIEELAGFYDEWLGQIALQRINDIWPNENNLTALQSVQRYWRDQI